MLIGSLELDFKNLILPKVCEKSPIHVYEKYNWVSEVELSQYCYDYTLNHIHKSTVTAASIISGFQSAWSSNLNLKCGLNSKENFNFNSKHTKDFVFF